MVFVYRFRLILCFISVLGLAPAVTGLAACKSCGDSDRLCGPQCLLHVCQYYGVDADIGELTKLCGYDEKDGTSMLGLLDAAKAKGLKAVGMKIGLDELAGLQVPAIAHLWDSHFVVVEATGSADTLLVTNPPREPVSVKNEDLQKAYSGFALLVSADAGLFPHGDASGPDLRFDGYAYDFGKLYEGDTAECKFTCRNVGNEDLVVTKVEASCSCLTPMQGGFAIPAGGTGEIEALFVSDGYRRGIAKKLLVTSNDPITPVVQLDVVGYVKSAKLLTSPRALDFGEHSRRDTVHELIYIPSSAEEKITVTGVSSDSPFVTAAVAQTKDYLRPGHMVMATLLPGAPIGKLNAKLTITSNHPRDPQTQLPVTAAITGDIAVDRNSLFFGMVRKGEAAESKIVISTTGEDPLEIEKVDNALDYIAFDMQPDSDGKKCVVTATINGDAPAGNISEEIVIHTNNADQPELKLPVYAYVQLEVS